MTILLARDIIAGRFSPEIVEPVRVNGRRLLRLHSEGRTVLVASVEAIKLADYLGRDRPTLAARVASFISDID